jgi:hypothetical protein
VLEPSGPLLFVDRATEEVAANEIAASVGGVGSSVASVTNARQVCCDGRIAMDAQQVPDVRSQ